MNKLKFKLVLFYIRKISSSTKKKTTARRGHLVLQTHMNLGLSELTILRVVSLRLNRKQFIFTFNKIKPMFNLF